MGHWALGIDPRRALGIGPRRALARAEHWEYNVGRNLHLALFLGTGKMPVPQEFSFLWSGFLARPSNH